VFDNVGRKIMTLAKIIGIIGVIAAVVFAIFLVIGLVSSDDEFWIIGLIGMGSGLVLFVSTWPLYAFGQITEDVRAIRNREYAKASAPAAVSVSAPAELPDL